jgi:GAF domain-containing protein
MASVRKGMPSEPKVAEVTTMADESQLVEAFVTLADTLVDEFDVVDLMHLLSDECTRLLGATAAGLLLADQRGGLQVVAASSEETRLLELFQVQRNEGPCLDCFRTGAIVAVPDLDQAADRWPLFVQKARAAGFQSVHALPMRLRNEVIGTLNMFGAAPRVIGETELRIAQGLADVATIGLLQERTVREAELLAEQLQTALTSRIIIEQAKGVLAERGHVDMGTSFTQLRAYARNHNRRLVEVASDVVEGRLDLADVVHI